MASVPVCDGCGYVSNPRYSPPDTEPVRFSDAVADYEAVLCNSYSTGADCIGTKTIAFLKSVAVAKPGGTVDGVERLPYLVHTDGRG